ncbi:carbonic anhydrase [Paracrocinitomix mangrovi]|uniref:carbonic anhydrase n=1 Tax=Paracrocinitomix mangrovi TaxID=2862509 RepID=UPI001C8D1597|nr:carbonic anhydrase [Paracrocinitomix mangrovi]UKN03599.1 carbonic anhydrase [Paracrocinitomix mangrovi]
MDIKKVFENNEKWIQDKLSVDANYFTELAKGQNPNLLYIGCADSRVTAEELMGCEPGEAFVHRNVANMVVSTDLNCQSVIEYAVKYLEVKDIVVCGHYGCGGVQAAMQSSDMGLLNPWLRNIRDVYRMHAIELGKIIDDNARYKRLVELNVQEQCINVIKTAVVQNAHRTRGITVHGWVFDLESGKLIDLKIDFNDILSKIMEIYRLEQD